MNQSISKNFMQWLVLLLLVVNAGVANAETVTIDGLEYTLEANTATVTGYTSEMSNDLVIPSTITSGNQDYTVTSIGYKAFYECYRLRTVIIPNSVTSIDSSAFYDCNVIKSAYPNTLSDPFSNGMRISYPAEGAEIEDGWVWGPNKSAIYFAPLTLKGECTIPGSVTSIGEMAFYNCGGFTHINIPESVTSIGTNAFKGCSSLASLEFNAINCKADGSSSCPVFPKTIATVIIGNTVTTIPSYFLFGGDKIENIKVPNSVTSIGNYAFSGCSGMTSISMGNSVNSIESNAFSNCSGLTSILIPESVTSIGTRAFSGCSSLASVEFNAINCTADGSSYCPVFPSSVVTMSFGHEVTAIPDYFLYGNDKIENIKVTNSVTSIGSNAFNGCSSMTSISMGNSVTSIGAYAFSDCSSLSSIVIPESVGYIGMDSFRRCSSLTSLEFNAINCITSGASFSPAFPNSLTSVTFGKNVTAIPAYCFYKSDKIENIVLPESLTSIGSHAFYRCSGLTSISLPKSLTTIGESAFYNCSSLTSIIIPNSITSVDSSAFSYCSGLKKSAYPNTISDPFYNGTRLSYPAEGAEIEDGWVWGPNKSAIYFAPLTLEGECKIPDSVTSIGDEAFVDCIGLTSVKMPNSVNTIGSSAFFNCSNLTSIIISNTITSIGDYTFSNCSGLTSVIVPNTLTSIGSHAFSNCRGLTSISFPNSLTSIGEMAFYECSGLTSVIIPNSVTSVDSSAFYNCGLKKSAYPNTISNPFYSGIRISYPAEGAEIEDGWVWGPNKSAIYFAPLTLEGEYKIPYSVTEIGEKAFYNCCTLTSVVIPNSVTSIGVSAFSDCIGLNSVVIPNTVTSIGESAFSDCIELNSVVIPNSVTSISNSTFYNCKSLKSLIISNSATSIGSSAFDNCSSLTSIIIPNSVKIIGPSAFGNCSSLTSIIIPNTVEAIGWRAFEGCSGLKKSAYPNIFRNLFDKGIGISYPAKGAIIEDGWVWGPDKSAIYFAPLSLEGECIIPNSVTSIGEYAFHGCNGITSLTSLATNVPILDSNSFDDDTYNTTLLTVPEGTLFDYYNDTYWNKFKSMHVEGAEGNVTAFNDGVFNYLYSPGSKEAMLLKGDYSSMSNVSIPNRIAIENGDDASFYNVTEIGKDAFKGCRNINAVTFSKNITKIGDNAFFGCSSLTSVDFPETLTSIGASAFHKSGLESITIPFSMESMGNAAFASTKIESIEIPDCVTYLGSSVFKNCENLKSVKYGKGIMEFPDSIFYHTAISEIVIGSNIRVIGKNAFQYTNLRSVEIPASVIAIGNQAFSSCESLSLFNLADGFDPVELGSGIIQNSFVNEMHVGRDFNSSAFENANIKNLTIGNNVTKVPDNAFSGCSNLSKLQLSSCLDSIGAGAFSNCALEDVVVSPSVKSIGTDAFASNKMKSLAIGYGIKEIGEKAFDGNNAIENVYVTAVNPPAANNNTFSRYEMPLWLINQTAFDNYANFPRCWYRFEDNMHTLVAINKLSAEKLNVSGLPGDTIKLEVKVEPADATLQQIFWRSTRPDLISVDNEGNVTFLVDPSEIENATRAGEEECQIIASTMYEDVPLLTFSASVGDSGVELLPDADGDGYFGNGNRSNDIYTLQGVRIKRNATQADVDALAPGLYIIGGKKSLLSN